MASVKKIPDHQVLANSLQSWAEQYELGDDPYVAGLTAAVSSRKNLPMWASLNPLEYLPHAKVQSNPRLHLATLIMTIARNALVFLPVALTWLAISKATNAFAIYTANNALQVVNFLDFWENGYGVLSKNWSLSSVATLDFLIILLIILLTISITLIEKRTKRLRLAEISELDEDRIRLAISISTYLFTQQKVTNVSMNQSLAKALRDILNSTDSLERTSKELNKTVKAIPTNRELLTEIKRNRPRSFLKDFE
jgi:capsular polysaccharide biosynthesis protein